MYFDKFTIGYQKYHPYELSIASSFLGNPFCNTYFGTPQLPLLICSSMTVLLNGVVVTPIGIQPVPTILLVTLPITSLPFSNLVNSFTTSYVNNESQSYRIYTL